MTQPLTDAINALTRYANEVTGQSDPDLSSAVRTLCDGYGQGGSGDHWVRPSDFPDYSKLDISNEEVLYLTYDTRMQPSFALFRFRGAYRVEIGTLNNGIFTVLESETFAKQAVYFKLLDAFDTDYIVLRITANNDTLIESAFGHYGTYTHEGLKYHSSNQSVVEAYGRLPNFINLNLFLRSMRNIRSITLYDLTSVTNFERFANDAFLLENVEITGVPQTASCGLYYAFTECRNLKYLYLHGAGIGNVQNTFANCFVLEFTDIEQLNVRTTGSISSLFNTCKGLKKLDLSNWQVTTSNYGSAFTNTYNLRDLDLSGWEIKGSVGSIFQSCGINKVPQANYGTFTGISSFFQYSYVRGTLDLRMFDFGTITQLTGLAYMPNVNSIIVPDNFTSIAKGVMRDDPNLQSIHFLATTPPTLPHKDALTWNNPSLTHIYVPYSADHSVLQAYQNASVWSQLTDYLVEEPQE